jgi:uncharacterized protein YneF (UPF0154 family)
MSDYTSQKHHWTMSSAPANPTPPQATYQRYLLNIVLLLASLLAGFWIVGYQHLMPWATQISNWIQGDNGSDIIHIIAETLKLGARLAIGTYGSYKLAEKIMARGC